MLTTQQVATLKTAVFASADEAVIDARTRGDTYKLAQVLNLAATPQTKAWRIAVPAADLDDAATYTTYDGLAQGKRDEWAIFLAYAPRNMSKVKNRSVVTDVWGAATAASISETILTASLEDATVAEVALGGITRTTGTVSALSRNWIGQVTQEDAQAILAA